MRSGSASHSGLGYLQRELLTQTWRHPRQHPQHSTSHVTKQTADRHQTPTSTQVWPNIKQWADPVSYELRADENQATGQRRTNLCHHGQTSTQTLWTGIKEKSGRIDRKTSYSNSKQTHNLVQSSILHPQSWQEEGPTSNRLHGSKQIRQGTNKSIPVYAEMIKAYLQMQNSSASWALCMDTSSWH